MHSQIKLGHIRCIRIGLHYSWFLIALLLLPSFYAVSATAVRRGDGFFSKPRAEAISTCETGLTCNRVKGKSAPVLSWIFHKPSRAQDTNGLQLHRACPASPNPGRPVGESAEDSLVSECDANLARAVQGLPPWASMIQSILYPALPQASRRAA